MSVNKYSPNDCVVIVTIASSGTESTSADLLGTRCVGMIIPDAIDGTAFNIQASDDGVSFYDMYNKDGTQFSIAVAADRWIAIAPSDLAGARYIKVASNATETAQRDIKLITRPLS